jgi:hypothetical protein
MSDNESQKTTRKQRNIRKLCEDMRPRDIAAVLQCLRFTGDGYCLLKLDRGVRDFLLRSVRHQ